MNDIEKTNIERTNSGKRMRRRKRMMSLYVFLVILLVLTVGITACFTFLFNVDGIVVSGESDTYTYMEIVETSGIKAGDNLFRLDTKKAEKKILDEMLYVETAKVERDFPSTIRITVTRCIPAYNIAHDNGVLLVSRKGKILSDNMFYSQTDEMPVIYGYDPADLTAGKQIESKNDNKHSAFTQFMGRFEKGGSKDIASVDLTNEYDIVVNYRSGMVFRMGNWSDIDYKLDLADHVMSDESIKGKRGELRMIGSNQCSFRSSGEAENIPDTTVSADETPENVDVPAA